MLPLWSMHLPSQTDMTTQILRFNQTDIAIEQVGEKPSSPHHKRLLERQTAVSLLARLTGRNDLTIAHHSHGEPFITDSENYPVKDWSISVTHTRGYVAIALSAKSVGIDMETVTDKALRIAQRFTTEDEMTKFKRLGLPEKLAATVVWTIKEAVYKVALTPGIALLDIMITDLSVNDDNRLCSTVTAGGKFYNCVTKIIYSDSITACDPHTVEGTPMTVACNARHHL